MSIIILSDLRHSAQCQTESAGLSLPWSVFEGSSAGGHGDEPQNQRELTAKHDFIARNSHIPNTQQLNIYVLYMSHLS